MEQNIILTPIAVLPSVVTILLAFLTREVLLSLFAGIITGGCTLYWQTGNLEVLNISKAFIVPALSSESYATIVLMYFWCVGGILGIWGKTGNADYFAKQLGKKIAQGPRSSLFLAWCLGMVFHQGGTISAILTGTTVKPVSDHYKVSHEELAYVVDSTGSPVATLIPFSTWPLIVSGFIVGSMTLVASPQEAYSLFLHAIPYNFYAIFAVSFTLLFSLNLMPWVGSGMAKAIERSRKYKLLDAPGAEPLLMSEQEETVLPEGFQPSNIGFLLPILMLLLFSIGPYFAWKAGLIDQKYSQMTQEAFLIALLSAIGIARMQGMPIKDIIDGVVTGCQEMTYGAILLGLATTLAVVSKEVHTAAYLVSIMSNNIPLTALPCFLMVLCMVVSFSTGMALGTYAVVLPVALPLAYSIYPDPTYVHICFGAVLGGVVFGDQCSPVSDTTILSSMFTGCDIMDHVRTQLPLCLLAASCGCVCSTLCVFFLV